MLKQWILSTALLCNMLLSCAQGKEHSYSGEWIGHLPEKTSFNFKVSLEKLRDNSYNLIIANEDILIDKEIVSQSHDNVAFTVGEGLFFDLKYEDNETELTGFLKTGRFLYHVTLKKADDDTYKGTWNPFMFNDGLQSSDIMLYMEETDNGLAGYPFFGDQRFRGAWSSNFEQNGNLLTFKDSNTGFNFRANLQGDHIDLDILLSQSVLTSTRLTYTDDGWEYFSEPRAEPQSTNTPPLLKDGWEVANSNEYGIDQGKLAELINASNTGELINMHSILIAKNNKLVFESYFGGYNAHIPHDLRSASKSISSAIIGIAIDDGLIKSAEEKLYDFIPEAYKYTKDSLKANITLQHLLTMSSGLDVNNKAAEDYYQNPNNSDNWLKTVLEAPMVRAPGTYLDYGSANPFLLGICLSEHLKTPLETYMDEKLFEPLGITNYINQTDDTQQRPYFGGGMLLTSRDLLKFGQLYLNKGTWNGKRIISESWVKESFKKYGRLQDTKDKNEYGYLWWHDTYEINGKEIKSIEARGAGGQFIFILPDLGTVVVITAGNFRNGKGNQSRDVLKTHILPALIQ
ncbi:serine hydrolase [Muricauda sp. HICW]|uniref:Serine hydrolase n=1 Tax=Flagellimonas chongwuensis TaxID=2697365 RepID=A0A850NGI6_9FLAO|nr:serine hydrolase [Allomuricauda chongwuensis]NVN18899.1 serine hydrolase [Allomuricauda chongwuensis]